jgi:hypothetical protein
MKADNFAGDEKPLEFITFSKKDGNLHHTHKLSHNFWFRFPGFTRGQSTTPIDWQRASRCHCGCWKVQNWQVIPFEQDSARVETK